MTEYIIVMSLGPTYRPTSPEATDEIKTFGVPMGKARMAGATIEAPPEPPALMIPTTSLCRRTKASKASAMAATDAPRSRPNTLDPPRPWFSATSCAVTSQVASLPLVETSTSLVLRPLPATMSRMKRSSGPLVSSVPTTRTVGGPDCVADVGARRSTASSRRVAPTEAVRALDSILAFGTG